MNKKFMTRLLDADYRNSILVSIKPEKLNQYKINQYARYSVDKAIISRNKEHTNDKAWQYGFQPLEVLAYVGKDGNLITRLFEFNTVNHFLKVEDGNTAVDVVKCILIQWVTDDKNIRDFDIDEIDAGLKKLEDEYLAQRKAEEEQIRRQAEMEASLMSADNENQLCGSIVSCA